MGILSVVDTAQTKQLLAELSIASRILVIRRVAEESPRMFRLDVGVKERIRIVRLADFLVGTFLIGRLALRSVLRVRHSMKI